MVNLSYSYIVYGNYMVYHIILVSKHHAILPWSSCFKTTWHTMVSMVYHGILPWLTCFKIPCYLLWYTVVYFHKGRFRAEAILMLYLVRSGANNGGMLTYDGMRMPAIIFWLIGL